jgi:RND family efflux transporter MFP subunit
MMWTDFDYERAGGGERRAGRTGGVVRFSANVVVLTAALVALTACSHPVATEPAPAAVSAPTEIVHAVGVAETRAIAGSVRAATVAPLAAKVMGNVVAIHVREGDRVRAGQLLVEIDDRGARALAAQAQAGSDAAARALGGAEAAVSAARANATLAETNYNRYAALRARGSVSPAELDEADARFKVAAAELERATKGREALVAQRDAARAASMGANVSLDDTHITAPISGVVTARFVDPGAQAAPGMPLLTIESEAAARVEATVPEDLVVQTGDAVTVESGGRRFVARVTQVVPVLDPAARSALVKIELPQNADLRSGAFANVLFATGSRRAITVPAAAVQANGALASVFVVGSDGAARMRLITCGDVAGGRVEILSGLDDGERILQAVRR